MALIMQLNLTFFIKLQTLHILVVAQLVNWLLLTPEICGSNQFLINLLTVNTNPNTKMK